MTMDNNINKTSAPTKKNDNAKKVEDKSEVLREASDLKNVSNRLVEPDVVVSAALRKMVEKAEQPMLEAHQHVMSYLVNIDNVVTQIIIENTALKEEMQAQLKLHQDVIIKHDQQIGGIKHDRDEWKTKAEQLKRAGEKLKSENNEHLSTTMALKRECDKLNSDLIEARDTITTRDLKQREQDIKMAKLCKSFDDQSQELKMCENSKRQLVEKSSSLERKIKEEEATKITLLTQLASLEKEKKRNEKELDILAVEKRKMATENADLQNKVTELQKKVDLSESTLNIIVAEEVARRMGPSIIMNQLILQKEEKMKVFKGKTDFLTTESKMEESLHGLLRKRQALDDDGAATTKIPEKKKRRKDTSAGVGGISDHETEEEGEIVDQQPQEATASMEVTSPTIIASSSAPNPPPPIYRASSNASREVTTIIPTIPAVETATYRTSNQQSANSNTSVGKGSKQRCSKNH